MTIPACAGCHEKYHKLPDLGRVLFLTVLEAGNSKIKGKQGFLVWAPSWLTDNRQKENKLCHLFPLLIHIFFSLFFFLFDQFVGMHVSSSAQSCPTLCDPMDCSPLGSSVHGIFQARILKWIDIIYSGESFQPKDWICLLHLLNLEADSLPTGHLGSPFIRTPALSHEGPTLITWFNLSYLTGPVSKNSQIEG